MTFKQVLLLLLLAVVLMVGMPMVSATSEAMDAFNEEYGTNDTRLATCTVCHDSDVESLNPYGMAFQENEGDFVVIEPLDSDNDGFTNIEEIDALTFPGDSEDNPSTVSSETSSSPGELNKTVTEQNDSVNQEDAYQSTGGPTELNKTVTETDANQTQEQADENESSGPGELNKTVTESNDTEDTSQQSPGFEAIFAAAGILMAIYLFRRK